MSRFVKKRSTLIEALEVEVHEFEHETGASYLHFQADHPEHAFLVAFRTLPSDSTGVAHILEHTALCGSERFPVRDPFFTMLRRSLSTFMNAFTTNDYTAYPFASTNDKDFDNLLAVYLDAVFFAKLDPLDFAQEGHRTEFEVIDDPESPLVYRGVVFNEMKGDMSSLRSQAWERLQYHLFKKSTYHFNSGGDPKEIPKLTYDGLRRFYEAHYHPSNAIFMTWGRQAPEVMMDRFESLALCRFKSVDGVIDATDEPRWVKPQMVQDVISGGDDGEGDHSGQLFLAWLLGPSTDLEAVLTAHLVVDLLLDSSAAPLRQVLDQCEFAESVSPLTGLEESNREMSFICGVEMADAQSLEAFKASVWACLEEVVSEGVPRERIEAALHQLELSQRELGGDGMPYGLQLMFSGLSAAVHRGDPVAVLDFDRALARLRASLEDQGPALVSQWISDTLLDNPHCLILALSIDPGLAASEEQAQHQALQLVKSKMSDAERTAVIDRARALAARQAAPEDLACLPKVGLEDVPIEKHYPRPSVEGGLTGYAAACNGLVYNQMMVPLQAMSADVWSALPLLSQLWGELGVADSSYLDMQDRQLSVCGGMTAYSALRSLSASGDRTSGYAVLSTRGLASNMAPMAKLLVETFDELRLDEWSRIEEILQQIKSRKVLGVVQSAHSLAMLASAGAWSKLSALNHRLSGLGSLSQYRVWCASLAAGETETLGSTLSELYQQLRSAPRSGLVVADGHHLNDALAVFNATSPDWRCINPTEISISQPLLPEAQAFFTATQANFCAACLPGVREGHEDAAPLMVLARILSQQYLHPVLREQGGAYGGGASFDQTTGLFRFYSFRDPELNKTLDTFRRAGQWVRSNPITPVEVEESVLSIVSGIDAPGSPAGEARTAHHQGLQGRSEETRRRFRQAILEVTPEAVMRASETYLHQTPSLAVVTSAKHQSQLSGDFVCEQLA